MLKDQEDERDEAVEKPTAKQSRKNVHSRAYHAKYKEQCGWGGKGWEGGRVGGWASG